MMAANRQIGLSYKISFLPVHIGLQYSMHLCMRETITKLRRSSPYRLQRYPVRPNFRHPTLPFILQRHQLVIPALLTTCRSRSRQLSHRGRIVTRNIRSQRLSQNNQHKKQANESASRYLSLFHRPAAWPITTNGHARWDPNPFLHFGRRATRRKSRNTPSLSFSQRPIVVTV